MIYHWHRQAEAIQHEVTVTTEAGKAAEVRRLATYQGYIKGFGITQP